MNELIKFVDQHAHEVLSAVIRAAIESQAATPLERYILAATLNGVEVVELDD